MVFIFALLSASNFSTPSNDEPLTITFVPKGKTQYTATFSIAAVEEYPVELPVVFTAEDETSTVNVRIKVGTTSVSTDIDIHPHRQHCANWLFQAHTCR
ncbi:hypothetical protein BLNAU_12100 [Blattamonas nauphoetae]|uniref:Uncharacterized protein n=1 Tax=Blattamonas nauphoetae TaxID=2049346 RepID=A0ABQ9XME1_9EUKA|nr:hypothetical protein BLNAU_12100 [Blattamonas nauphoetae]